jgi:hypothetical protein
MTATQKGAIRMTTIKVDYENNSDGFWQEMTWRPDAPAELKKLATEPHEDEITVSEERAREIEAWCRQVPSGYFCEDENAPTPIIFCQGE